MAELAIYDENGNPIVSSGAVSFDAPVGDLVRNTVELYVNTTTPLVVAHVVAKTTILRRGDRAENLHFAYRPDERGGLVREFTRIFEEIDQSEIDHGQTAEELFGDRASRSALSPTVATSGLFEEQWSVDRTVTASRIPWLLESADAELPSLGYLGRRVVETLVEDGQQLTLEMDSYEDAVRTVKYLIEAGHDTTVAISGNGRSGTALSETQVVLVPGRERNFEAVDSRTETALVDRRAEILDQLKEEFLGEFNEYIDDLATAGMGDSYVEYTDLVRLRRGIDRREPPASGRLDTHDGQAIADLYVELLSDENLPQETTRDVEGHLAERLDTRISALEEDFLDDWLPAFETQLTSLVGRSGKSPDETYEALADILQVTAVSDPSQAEPDTPFESVHRIAQEWQRLLSKELLSEEVRERAREEIQFRVEREQRQIRERIVDETVESLTESVEQATEGRHPPKKTCTVLDDIRAILQGDLDPDDATHQTWAVTSIAEEIQRARERPAITVDDIEDIVSEVVAKVEAERESVAGEIRKEFQDTLTDEIGAFLNDDRVTTRDKLVGLETIESLLNDGSGSVRQLDPPNEHIQRTADFIEELETQQYLSDERIRDVYSVGREAVREEKERYRRRRRQGYTKKLERKVQSFVDEFGSDRETVRRGLDQFEAIVHNRGDVDELDFDVPHVRNFRQTVTDLVEESLLTPDQRDHVLNVTEKRIEAQRQRFTERSASPSDDEDIDPITLPLGAHVHLPRGIKRRLDRTSQRSRFLGVSAFSVLLTLVLVGAVLIGSGTVGASFLPGANSSTGTITMSAPAGGTANGTTVNVAGTAANGSVTLTVFDGNGTVEIRRSVSVADRRFDTSVEVPGPGLYIVEVQPENATDPQRQMRAISVRVTDTSQTASPGSQTASPTPTATPSTNSSNATPTATPTATTTPSTNSSNATPTATPSTG